MIRKIIVHITRGRIGPGDAPPGEENIFVIAGIRCTPAPVCLGNRVPAEITPVELINCGRRARAAAIVPLLDTPTVAVVQQENLRRLREHTIGMGHLRGGAPRG
jgi:hypothetical protein